MYTYGTMWMHDRRSGGWVRGSSEGASAVLAMMQAAVDALVHGGASCAPGSPRQGGQPGAAPGARDGLPTGARIALPKERPRRSAAACHVRWFRVIVGRCASDWLALTDPRQSVYRVCWGSGGGSSKCRNCVPLAPSSWPLCWSGARLTMSYFTHRCPAAEHCAGARTADAARRSRAGRLACRASYRLAHYADGLYRSALEHRQSPEWATAQAIIHHKRAEVRRCL